MVAVILRWLFLMASSFLQSSALIRHSSEITGSEALGAVQTVISSQSQHECPVLLVLNNLSQITLTFLKEAEAVLASRGVTVFHVKTDDIKGNATQTHSKAIVNNVRQMGQLWHCLVVVVVSDDSTFLTAFAYLSLRRHALRWTTRILILTRLPLSKLGGLHGLLSNRNVMVLRVHEGKESVRSVGVYVALPFSARTQQPRRVATWTPRTWKLAASQELFPEKFNVFTSSPTLAVAIELLPHHTISWKDDPDSHEGHRLAFTGYMDRTITYFAKAMNFTHRYVVSPERTFGTRLPDGTWTGMMGMVVREEVDFGAGPFMLSPVRASAADHTLAIWTGNVKMVSGLGGLKIDPWGFLLPFTPLVWTATLTALLGVFIILHLPSSCVVRTTLGSGGWSTTPVSSVRVIFQQDILWLAEWWWWERLVLGLWMLMTLVLTKSYAGNLMSLLAVRYVPQPFQTPRDVLNDPHVAMIWQKYSKNEQFLRDVESGVFRDVADLEGKGRLKFHTQAQFLKSLDTLVRAGDHVLVDIEITIRNLIALDVSQKGRCDFYLSRDGFLPYSSAIMSQKTNPLIHGLNPRVLALSESGLFKYWMQNVPNFTTCNSVPKTVLFTTTLSTTNLWGMFVVLAVGLITGLMVWCAELLISKTM